MYSPCVPFVGGLSITCLAGLKNDAIQNWFPFGLPLKQRPEKFSSSGGLAFRVHLQNASFYVATSVR